ncbi:hypothetical protein ACIQXW_04550 [Lysinibacillus sp. NPDC097162]|uniref:hypothetical protein n=1 Tax=Lysinibacillus sp. NPDC097162 TaxID=3364140 RepID=UPI0038280A1E
MKKFFFVFLSFILLFSVVTPGFAQATEVDNLNWVDIEEEENSISIFEAPEIFDSLEEIDWDNVEVSLIEEEVEWHNIPIEVNEEILSNGNKPRFLPLVARLVLSGGKYVIRWGSKVFKKAPKSKVSNALTNFETATFRAGSHTFRLTKPDMEHMLTRHHPKYWDGSIRGNQSFYNPNLSVDDVKSIALNIAKQNNTILAKKGTNGMFRVEGQVDGVKYVLGIKDGHIRQLYPKN